MELLISVIIPIYNVEKHLEKCILSVLNTTIENIELILINDGSTDNSLNIVKEFVDCDNRIKLITKINGGVSSARNLGLENANGKWIYFLDADDYINNYTFENLIPILSSTEYDMILGNYNCVDSNHELKYTTNNKTYSKKGEDLIVDYGLWRHKIVNMSALLIKKSLIVKHNILFNENTKYAEDTEFINYCLLNAEKVVSVKNSFFNYVVHNESAISNINFSRFDVYESKKRILDYISINHPTLIEPKKMFIGFLLPEAIIDTIELLCKEGVSLKNIKKYLQNNNYYRVLTKENFNEYTPLAYIKKINLFLNTPKIFWGLNFLKPKQYQLRVFVSNTLRLLKLNEK